jgi:putative ABC transport system ATP-binding protein
MLFEIKNAEYKEKDQIILDYKTLGISKGKHILLLGPSGCGKTTLMNMMAGLLRASSGQVYFDGKNYASLSDQELDHLRAENFGFVFQRLHLIGHLSVAQNIALAQTKTDPARVQTLINDLGLSGKEGEKARDLSVGEAQRVAIARAVANNPKVIFADEPTSALDDANAAKVMDLIFTQATKTGTTVIAATHDARIKDRFETILEMAA